MLKKLVPYLEKATKSKLAKASLFTAGGAGYLAHNYAHVDPVKLPHDGSANNIVRRSVLKTEAIFWHASSLVTKADYKTIPDKKLVAKALGINPDSCKLVMDIHELQISISKHNCGIQPIEMEYHIANCLNDMKVKHTLERSRQHDYHISNFLDNLKINHNWDRPHAPQEVSDTFIFRIRLDQLENLRNALKSLPIDEPQKTHNKTSRSYIFKHSPG